MLIKIQSDTPIDNLTLRKIIDIFKESQCPYESLFFSIENFKSFDGQTVQLGKGGRFLETFSVEGGFYDA